MQTTSSTDTERNMAIELILEDVPGGGLIATSDLPTTLTELKAGALVAEDSDGIWHVAKTALVAGALPASGITTLRVYNNHLFKAGDLLGYYDGTASGVRITSIAASGTGYDVFTISAAMAKVIPVSGIVMESATSGFPNVGFLYSPTAITTNTVDTTASGNNGCGLLVRGRVRETEMSYPVNSTIKALLPLIRFV